jgi:two-component system, NarL family, invasion response regulator UvrY
MHCRIREEWPQQVVNKKGIVKKITIVIVDDHKLIRQMWLQMFAPDAGIRVIGESGTLDEAVEMVKIKRPDIVLLDINLEQESGMDAVPLIRKFSPETRIIAATMHNQPAYAKKMLQLGAKGYITKNSPHEEVIRAIEEVMKGGVYVCAEIKNILSDQIMNRPAGSGTKELSSREMEIVKLIKNGFSSKEISSLINISIRTVEVHRRNILQKLKLRNTAALINFINDPDRNFVG